MTASYWRTATASAYSAVVRQIEADECERQAPEDRTLDQMLPSEQQAEIEHQYQGEDSSTGVRMGRHWRDTGRWISYRLKARDGTNPATAIEPLLTFNGGDHNETYRYEAGEHATVALAWGDARRTLRTELMAPDGSGRAQEKTVRFVGDPTEVRFDLATARVAH